METVLYTVNTTDGSTVGTIDLYPGCAVVGAFVRLNGTTYAILAVSYDSASEGELLVQAQ